MTKRRTSNVLISCSLAASLVMSSGCVTTSTEGEGAVLGALAGAGIGALACKGKDKAKCAAIGAAVGGGLGYAAGKVVAERQKQYASQEDFYDAQIRQTAQLNQKLAGDNKSLRASIKNDQRQLAAITAKNKKGQASNQQLIAAKSSMDQKRLDAEKRLKEAKQELEVQQTVLAILRIKALLRQVAPSNWKSKLISCRVKSMSCSRMFP
jgi:uncharacterized protein HemX